MGCGKQTATIIARQIVARSKKHWRKLYADALEEINMSNSTSTVTSSMNVSDTPASRTQIGREIPDNPASLAAASPARLAGVPSADSINSGMACGSQLPAPTAKPVDSKTIVGSYPGDHRAQSGDTAKASLDACADNGGPRNSVGQFKNSRNDKGAGFQSTDGTTQVGD